MTEKLLQFIWQFQYYNNTALQTTNGETLQILQPGILNNNQGPDFLNASIKCGNTILVGSIEIHVKASLWLQHKHNTDNNYNNVILHVVLIEDVLVNAHIPTLELGTRISNILLEKYQYLMDNKQFIPCQNFISTINSFTITSWLDRLFIERLQHKATYIKQLLQNNNNHWEQVFWQLLAKNFGVKINSEAFEQIAISIPITVLAKHKNQIHQLEALLLGQAGLLEANFVDEYAILLQKEYIFLQKKYNLLKPTIAIQFLRMRPANFPTIRLAQLANLIHNSQHLFATIKTLDTVQQLEQMLQATANDYWHYHYVFDELTAFKHKNIGKQMIQNICINTIVPILYAYGWYNDAIVYQQKAIQWAETLNAEKNTITTGFEKCNILNLHASTSQALIQLKNNYCNKKLCLTCAIGNQFLKA